MAQHFDADYGKGIRMFALIAGIIYLLVGIMGFIPGLVSAPDAQHNLAVDANYGLLLGLFPINLVHNVIHLAIGLWGIASYSRTSAARGFSRSLAILYGLFTIMGLIPGLDTTFGLAPLFGHDVWLHGLTALAAAYFGWVYRSNREGAAA